MKYPASTVDIIIEHKGQVVLIRRGHEPFKGKLALPGGFHNLGESLEDAAVREAKEETGLDIVLINPGNPWTYSTPGRDPRGDVNAHLYFARSVGGQLQAGYDARDVYLKTRDELGDLVSRDAFAFDHKEMVERYLRVSEIRTKFEWSQQIPFLDAGYLLYGGGTW